MSFNSLHFFFYVFAVFICYLLVRPTWRAWIILIASLFFFGYHSVLALVLILCVTLVVFLATHITFNLRLTTAIGVVFLLTFLIALKVLASDFGDHNQIISVVAVLGSSYYILQAIGYLIDIRDQKFQLIPNFKSTLLFLGFFPQAPAGPIHRASELLPQIGFRETPSLARIVCSLKVILWGYFCKLIIADKIYYIITPIFSTVDAQDGSTLAISAILYSLQIYFDFYAYTQIAIGIASLFGVSFTDNFNQPYLAISFREFWRRWHISLSRWLRDYVYIRLGGRTNSPIRFLLVVLATFVLSGLWHGIGQCFILWGVLHAILYFTEDRISRSIVAKKLDHFRLTGIIRRILFLALVTLTWLVFRSTSLSELLDILTRIFQPWHFSTMMEMFNSPNWLFVCIAPLIILFQFDATKLPVIHGNSKNVTEYLLEYLFVTGCLLLIAIFGGLGTPEFLYFSF